MIPASLDVSISLKMRYCQNKGEFLDTGRFITSEFSHGQSDWFAQLNIPPDSKRRDEVTLKSELVLLVKSSEAKVAMEAEATSVRINPPIV